MVSKPKHSKVSASGIRQVTASDAPLRFSFRFFDPSDCDVCPPVFRDGYVHILMERLKALSAWTVNEFVSPKGKGIRNHPIDWVDTSKPDGFGLPEQYEAYTPFQFSLTANEHGRVHGLLVDDTFHVIWLDHDHRLYP